MGRGCWRSGSQFQPAIDTEAALPTPVRLTEERDGEPAGSYRSTNIFSRSFAKVLIVFSGVSRLGEKGMIRRDLTL
jgi:hypothetical protein